VKRRLDERPVLRIARMASMPTWRFGDEMIAATVSARRVRAAGLDVAYDRAGEGPPLVLVHGAGGDAREWRPQMTGLADDFTVIAWDEPGAGRSSDVPADFGLAGYATALAALVETLGAPAHLCGLSWGGTVTLELYRRRPELVATLVLADTYAGWKGSLPEHELHARVASVERMLGAPAEKVQPTVPGLFAGEPPHNVVELLDAVAADVRPESVRVALGAIAEADLRDVLPRIAVPTLLVWGELDARSPLSVAREFARAIPHAELVVIPGAGHMSNLERPDEFNAAVRDFCRRGP
jgi:pimeloyl-ACP methyl ester carboxylesterase